MPAAANVAFHQPFAYLNIPDTYETMFKTCISGIALIHTNCKKTHVPFFLIYIYTNQINLYYSLLVFSMVTTELLPNTASVIIIEA